MNYTIHSKNTQLLPKSTKFFPKIPYSCEKEPGSSKNIPILAAQRDTNFAKNTHFYHKVAQSCKKNANCNQNKILSNIYLKYIKN